MKKHFVKNANYRRFMTAIARIQRRGAEESSLILVYGPPGVGKTRTVNHYGAMTDAITTCEPDTAKIARRDTLRSASDSTKLLPGGEGVSDSLAKTPRSLPPRTLTLRQQVMFAGGFMAFVALMMASMQNFNP